MNTLQGILGALLAAMLLMGCASAPLPPPPSPLADEAQQYERQAQEDSRHGQINDATDALQRALHIHALLDDIEGQFRTRLDLVRLHLLGRKTESAIAHLDAAQALVTHQPDVSAAYAYHLLSGRARQNSADFESALAFATSPDERAVALTYLGREAEGWALIEGVSDNDAAAERGFVSLSWAISGQDIAAANAALVHYRNAEDPIGVSDSLYLLGLLHHRQNNVDAALHYLKRASVVNAALGDESRSAASEQLLRDAQAANR